MIDGPVSYIFKGKILKSCLVALLIVPVSSCSFYRRVMDAMKRTSLLFKVDGRRGLSNSVDIGGAVGPMRDRKRPPTAVLSHFQVIAAAELLAETDRLAQRMTHAEAFMGRRRRRCTGLGVRTANGGLVKCAGPRPERRHRLAR